LLLASPIRFRAFLKFLLEIQSCLAWDLIVFLGLFELFLFIKLKSSKNILFCHLLLFCIFVFVLFHLLKLCWDFLPLVFDLILERNCHWFLPLVFKHILMSSYWEFLLLGTSFVDNQKVIKLKDLWEISLCFSRFCILEFACS